MKDEVLGLNHLLSLPATLHTVRPRSSAVSFGHLRMAPPQSSSGMPRCVQYHAASAALSPVLLMNTPPSPVTFAIVPSFGFIRVTASRTGQVCRRTISLIQIGANGEVQPLDTG